MYINFGNLNLSRENNLDRKKKKIPNHLSYLKRPVSELTGIAEVEEIADL